MFTLFMYSVALMYTALHYNKPPERSLALAVVQWFHSLEFH